MFNTFVLNISTYHIQEIVLTKEGFDKSKTYFDEKSNFFFSNMNLLQEDLAITKEGQTV